jgi:hypothetical protein
VSDSRSLLQGWPRGGSPADKRHLLRRRLREEQDFISVFHVYGETAKTRRAIPMPPNALGEPTARMLLQPRCVAGRLAPDERRCVSPSPMQRVVALSRTWISKGYAMTEDALRLARQTNHAPEPLSGCLGKFVASAQIGASGSSSVSRPAGPRRTNPRKEGRRCKKRRQNGAHCKGCRSLRSSTFST